MAERVVFSRSLYLPEAVRAAMDAYAQLATFDARVSANDVEVTITKPDAEVADVLVGEFCNHVLHETIVRLRSNP